MRAGEGDFGLGGGKQQGGNEDAHHPSHSHAGAGRRRASQPGPGGVTFQWAHTPTGRGPSIPVRARVRGMRRLPPGRPCVSIYRGKKKRETKQQMSNPSPSKATRLLLP